MWYESKKFWAAVVSALALVAGYFREELGPVISGIGTELLKLLLVVAVVASCATVPACGWLTSTIPVVTAFVTRAANVIDTIEQFADLFFQKEPNPKAQTVVDEAILRARAALDAVSHGGAGVDKARLEFEKAYAELLKVVAPLGVRSAEGGLAVARRDELASEGGLLLELRVPPPDELTEGL